MHASLAQLESIPMIFFFSISKEMEVPAWTAVLESIPTNPDPQTATHACQEHTYPLHLVLHVSSAAQEPTHQVKDPQHAGCANQESSHSRTQVHNALLAAKAIFFQWKVEQHALSAQQLPIHTLQGVQAVQP
jgi:hypothetical protein